MQRNSIELDSKSVPQKIRRVRYYGPKTCYDGRLLNGEKRHYPDEYIIASILQKYLHHRLANFPGKKIHVLTEPWEKSRDGSTNININQILLDKISSYNANEHVLLLTPFHYRYHHPGIALLHSANSKHAIFIDPKGETNSAFSLASYAGVGSPDLPTLKDNLIAKQYQFEAIKAQQQKESDDTSCGPILTSSMLHLIEEHLENDIITTKHFKKDRANLATDRLFQMYIQNSIKTPGLDAKELVNEIMFADEKLMLAFLEEQNAFNKALRTEIAVAIAKQKKFLANNTADILQPIEFIIQFQAKIIELVFLQKQKTLAQNIEEITTLLNLAKKYSPTQSTLTQTNELFKPQNFPLVKTILGYVASPQIIQDEKAVAIPSPQAILIDQLALYNESRRSQWNWFRIFGHSGKDKMSAAVKMIMLLTRPDSLVNFTAAEISALNEGRLGEIIKANQAILPQKFFTKQKELFAQEERMLHRMYDLMMKR